MHLSLLSSGISSDLFDDAGAAATTVGARHHLDGILRGLAFVAALLMPFALTFAPAALGHLHRAGLSLEAHR